MTGHADGKHIRRPLFSLSLRACRISRPEIEPSFSPARSGAFARQYVLDAERACGRCVHYPLELMAAGGPAGMTIASVVVQLRCKNCGQRPGKVTLLEHGAAGSPGMMGDRTRGGATGWAVPLVGEDGPQQ